MNNRIIYCILLIFLPSNFIQHWNLCWFIFVCFCLLLHLHWHGISSNKSDSINGTKNRFSIQSIDRIFVYIYDILPSPFKHILKSYSCVLVVKEQGIFYCVHKLCERWMSNNVLQRNFWSSTFFIIIFFLFVLFSVSYVWKKEKAIFGKVIE